MKRIRWMGVKYALEELDSYREFLLPEIKNKTGEWYNSARPR